MKGQPDWRARLGAAVTLLLVAAFYLWGLGDRGLQDPDEGMYAEIAREMLVRADWVVPTFNGVPYIEKPPLVYWLTAGTYRVLGVSEFSARLWKVLPMLGTIGLTMGLAGRLVGARAGIPAALILATTLGTYLFGRISQMDPMHLFGLTLAATGVVQAGLAAAGEPGRPGAYAFWAGTAIAVMSKGLPGLLFPAVLLGCWMLAHGSLAPVRRLRAWPAVLLAAAVTIPWHIAAAATVPGFARFYFWDNQILRFLGQRAYREDGTGLPTAAFLLITAFSLLPWLPYVAAATWPLRPRSESDRHRLFLVCWVAAVLGIFAASAFKLEYYALPAFPAAACLAAGVFHGATGALPGQQAGARWRALQAWTLVAVLGGVGFTGAAIWLWLAGQLGQEALVRALALWSTNYRVILDQGLPLPAVSPAFFAAVLIGGGVCWTAAFTAALAWLGRGRVGWAAASAGAAGLVLCLLGSAVLRAVEPHHSMKPLARRVAAEIRPGDVVVHERGLEKGGGLLFYLQRTVLVLNGRRGDLEFGSRLPGAQERFVEDGELRGLWTGTARVFLVTDLPPARSAVARLGEPRLLLASTATRWLYANR